MGEIAMLRIPPADLYGETHELELLRERQHQMQALLQRLEQQAEGLRRQNDELVRAQEEGRRATDRAEAANRAKDELLANVSHEIRTPMNAILGMTELVLEMPLGEGQRQWLETVRSAAGNLLGTLNALLDFSKIEAGKVELDPTGFFLRAAVGETVRAQAVRADRKGLELICHVHRDVPDALVGDVGRLRQVLMNLVDNAIKFTDKGEILVEIGVAAGPHADGEPRVRFAVRDTGIGIPRDKQETIFRAFEQEDMSTTRKYGGTGLGLTIAGRLIALMGGDLTVESEAGRGSTFAFTARFGRPASPDEALSAGSQVALRDRRVLVVDDNALHRDILGGWLRGWAMEPTAVGDGVAAMDQLWEGVTSGRPYDLVLLDAHIPDSDSLALACRIRERSALAATRIVVLTSAAHPDALRRYGDVRVDAHLIKPALQHELCAVLQSLLGRSLGPTAPVAACQAPRPEGRGAAPLRILVADDSEFNCELLGHLLTSRGHVVRFASTGRDTLRHIATEAVDVLLLDVQMPELDGFEVIRVIRQRESVTGQHLPVVAVTGRTRKEEHLRCVAAGMDDVVIKPIRAADLWTTLERVVG